MASITVRTIWLLPELLVKLINNNGKSVYAKVLWYDPRYQNQCRAWSVSAMRRWCAAVIPVKRQTNLIIQNKKHETNFRNSAGCRIIISANAQTDGDKDNQKQAQERAEKAKQKLPTTWKMIPHFHCRNQLPQRDVKPGYDGHRWCFSTTSLLESQCIKNGGPELDISEMYSVR